MPAKFMMTAALAAVLTGCSSLTSTLLAPDVRVDGSALKTGNYALDPTHASLQFSLNHMDLSDLYGRFDRFEISLNLDENTPEAAELDVLIDLDSLFVATPDFSETLQGPGWFNVSDHPQARFESETITRTGDTTAEVVGTLTLNGRQAPVTLAVTFNGGAQNMITGKYTVGFNATGSLNRSDFGLGEFVPLVGDEVTLRFSGEFVKD